MVVTSRYEVPDYDRARELRAFDDTKAGVKGLVDAGVTEIPRIFHHPPDNFDKNSATTGDTQFSIPVIDLGGIDKDVIKRKEIVERVGEASKIWGFFHVVNHGIPVSVLEEMKEGVRRFYEQDTEVKKELYTRDRTRPVVYNSNFDLYSGVGTNWRDTFSCMSSKATRLASFVQDHTGGLQVLHQNKWIDIPPLLGALVVNIGNLLQLITNDRFKSVEHRVLANQVGPRVSVASFFLHR